MLPVQTPDTDPVRNWVSGAVMTTKQVYLNLKEVLPYNALKKELKNTQMMRSGLPSLAYTKELELDMTPLMEATTFSELFLMNLLADFLKV